MSFILHDYIKIYMFSCISEASCIFSPISTYSYVSGPWYLLQSKCLMFDKYRNKLKWDLYDAILAMCVFSFSKFTKARPGLKDSASHS